MPIGPCPGCTLGVDGTILLGNQLLITVPLLPSLVGSTLSFQGLQINAALGGCFGQFQLSNTLDVTVQYARNSCDSPGGDSLQVESRLHTRAYDSNP